MATGNEPRQELPPLPDVETDVYNFGVLLLEIVSGRLPYSEEQGHLSNWVNHSYKKMHILLKPYILVMQHGKPIFVGIRVPER